MTRDPSGDINISQIPVEGIGGLGLVAMAGLVAFFLPELRWVAVITLIGGVALGLARIAYRHRRARRSALFAGVILGLAIAVASYLWWRAA